MVETIVRETQKKYIASLSDEQMELMKQMLKEQSDTNADQLANSGKYSTSNYDNNMKTLGYSVVFRKQRHCLLQILRDPETVVPGINTESETRLDLAVACLIDFL